MFPVSLWIYRRKPSPADFCFLFHRCCQHRPFSRQRGSCRRVSVIFCSLCGVHVRRARDISTPDGVKRSGNRFVTRRHVRPLPPPGAADRRPVVTFQATFHPKVRNRERGLPVAFDSGPGSGNHRVLTGRRSKRLGGAAQKRSVTCVPAGHFLLQP